jgi:superfamily II DNA or RNA helicase
VVGLDDVAQIKEGNFGYTKVTHDTTSEDVSNITSQVVVATIQSLSARMQDERTRDKLKYWLNNICKLVIVDECQAVGTKTWDDVLNECNAPLRICLSATPNRTDGAKLKINAQSGNVLFSTTAEEQIKKGRLCELDIQYRVFDHKLFNLNDDDIQYIDAYRTWIAENTDRNMELIIRPAIEMVNEGRFVLVLIQLIDHGFLLRDMFIREGMNPNDVRFVYGSTADEVRKSAIKEFKKGAFKILIGSTIFDAGVNIPAISGVILAGAGNSEITLIQRIGRGARTVDYEQVLGYLPEFMKQNHNQKVTKVIDVFDANVKFFTSQARNRYYIAKEEFGEDRVHIIGDITQVKRKRKAQVRNEKELNSLDEQLALLENFQNETPLETRKVQTDKLQSDFLSAFKKI